MTRAAVLALALSGCAAPVAQPVDAPARPMRVMSLNQCADQYVLALLPPERIASVTWLSRDPVTSVMAGAAARVPANAGTAEEVLRDRPDLVVAGSFTTPATRALLKRVGVPVLEIDHPGDLAAIRATTRRLAAALDERARGEALVARMDATLARLAADPAPPVRVAAWDGSGFGATPGSLYDELLTAAGARNIARDGQDAPDVEALLAARPAALVRGLPSDTAEGRSQDAAAHPVVRRLWAGRTLAMPQWATVCGTPFSVDAAVGLRNRLRSLVPLSAPAAFSAPASAGAHGGADHRTARIPAKAGIHTAYAVWAPAFAGARGKADPRSTRIPAKAGIHTADAASTPASAGAREGGSRT